jgi:hypothetical protein
MTSPSKPGSWRKSSFSGNESNCVEAAVITGRIPGASPSPASRIQQ